MGVKRTAHAVYNIRYHFVWTPKYRKTILQRNVKAYIEYLLRRISGEYGFEIVELELMPEHVHLFMSSPPKYSPAEIMKTIKGRTSKEIFEKFPELKEQLWAGEFWSDGYYVGTSGEKITDEIIKKYIRHQRQLTISWQRR